MRTYGFDSQDLSLIEKGECDLKEARKLFELCYDSGLKNYESGEEAISMTSFGLAKSEEDFIEISCNGKDSVLIQSNRLFYPSVLSRWLSPKRHIHIVGDKSFGIQVIESYFALDRSSFEKAYLKFLAR